MNIEQLKRNKKRFKDLSPEEQLILKRIPHPHLMVLDPQSNQFITAEQGPLKPQKVYRIAYLFSVADGAMLKISKIELSKDSAYPVLIGTGIYEGLCIVLPVAVPNDAESINFAVDDFLSLDVETLEED